MPLGLLYEEIKATDRFEDDYTAALYIAYRGIVPPKEWQHC